MKNKKWRKTLLITWSKKMFIEHTFKENQDVMHKGMVDDGKTLSLHKHCVLSPYRISVRLYLLFKKFNDFLLLDWTW